jgi:hypothetical protein
MLIEKFKTFGAGGYTQHKMDYIYTEGDYTTSPLLRLDRVDLG